MLEVYIPVLCAGFAVIIGAIFKGIIELRKQTIAQKNKEKEIIKTVKYENANGFNKKNHELIQKNTGDIKEIKTDTKEMKRDIELIKKYVLK